LASEPHSGRTASFTGGGRIRLTTDPARPVHQHRQVAVAVFPQRPTDHHGRPPPTADVAQLSASSINTSGGAAAGLLRAGPPGRCTAAVSPVYDGPYRVLERSTHFFLLEMGERTDKVPTLRLKAAQTPADTEPAKPPRRGHPVAQAPPVHALPPTHRGRPRQVTFNLPPTKPPTTSSTSASSRPLRNARPPNRLNL
jgi:hypothetical protein